MALSRKVIEKEGGSNIPALEEGTYMARIVQVIDLGRQEVTDFKTGKPNGYKHKAHITFEFPDETIELDGEQKPRWYGKDYVVSFHEKSAMYALLTNLKKTDIESVGDLVNTPCMVTIGRTANDKPKVTTVAGVPKGVKVGALVNTANVFDMDDPDMEVWERLPQFIQENIKSSPDYEGSTLQNMIEDEEQEGDTPQEDFDDDVPFDDD